MRIILTVIVILITIALIYSIWTKELKIPGPVKHFLGISDKNIKESNSYIIFHEFGSTDEPTHFFIDCTFINNKSKHILIKEMRLLCAETENSLGSSLIPWEENSTIKLLANNTTNKKIYFGKSKEDLMSTLSYFSGLPIYLTLEIKYITPDGEKHHEKVKFGRITIKGQLDGYYWRGTKNKVIIK